MTYVKSSCIIVVCLTLGFLIGYCLNQRKKEETLPPPGMEVVGYLPGSTTPGKVWILHQNNGYDILIFKDKVEPPQAGVVTVSADFSESFTIEDRRVRVFTNCRYK